MVKRFKNRKGYTLFELVIVAIIIIILSAIAIPNYLHLKYKASEARAYQDLAFIAYTCLKFIKLTGVPTLWLMSGSISVKILMAV
jgi:type II secretory pathway pseudopilin PulG